MAKATKDETPQHLQVRSSFTTLFKGATVTYREGEPVRSDDPVARKYPDQFMPLQFPHDSDAPAPAPAPEPEPEPEPEPIARAARAGAVPPDEPEEG